jgi:hypothetical protein
MLRRLLENGCKTSLSDIVVIIFFIHIQVRYWVISLLTGRILSRRYTYFIQSTTVSLVLVPTLNFLAYRRAPTVSVDGNRTAGSWVLDR